MNAPNGLPAGLRDSSMDPRGGTARSAKEANGRPNRVVDWMLKTVSRFFAPRTAPSSPKGGVTPGKEWRRRAYDERGVRDFIADADAALTHQDPLSARRALEVSFVVVGVLLLWAGFAEVDQITRGDGKVIPSKQLQVIQSLDGGVVSEIKVREGDIVEIGQVLLRIDATRFASSFNESRSQYLALMGKAARLSALADAKPFSPPEDLVAEAPELLQQERALYLAKQAELEANIGIARQQLTQRSQELNEAHARRVQASAGHDLTARELELTRPLVASGAVSDVDLLRLERDVSRYAGERNQATAQIARLQAAIAEAQGKIEEVSFNFRNQARSELAETNQKINGLIESSVALSDKVKQTDVKAQVRGTVKRLLVNTVGGVIQPGKDILEVVPLEDSLLLEARVHPKDIAFLHPEQKAFVKFTAYDYAIYGGLEARLDHISADTVVDDKGNAFYLVRVRTLKPNLGPNLPIIPGMVAEVDILTGKKSILSYLLKPVLRAKQYALSER